MTISDRHKYGLPPRLFLYTVDQIADMLSVSDMTKVLHYEGRTPGVAQLGRMRARNIMPVGEKPEWRIEEAEFIRWMKHTGTISLNRTRRQ